MSLVLVHRRVARCACIAGILLVLPKVLAAQQPVPRDVRDSLVREFASLVDKYADGSSLKYERSRVTMVRGCEIELSTSRGREAFSSRFDLRSVVGLASFVTAWGEDSTGRRFGLVYVRVRSAPAQGNPDAAQHDIMFFAEEPAKRAAAAFEAAAKYCKEGPF
jgi:hypothetical protein